MARPRKFENETDEMHPHDPNATMVTWLGEDELHPDGSGPSKTTCYGKTFTKGQAVPMTDAGMIAKAKGNPYFSVEGAE